MCRTSSPETTPCYRYPFGPPCLWKWCLWYQFCIINKCLLVFFKSAQSIKLGDPISCSILWWFYLPFLGSEGVLSSRIELDPKDISFLHIICIYIIHRYQSYYMYGVIWKYNDEYIKIPWIKLMLNLWHSEFLGWNWCRIYGTQNSSDASDVQSTAFSSSIVNYNHSLLLRKFITWFSEYNNLSPW